MIIINPSRSCNVPGGHISANPPTWRHTIVTFIVGGDIVIYHDGQRVSTMCLENTNVIKDVDLKVGKWHMSQFSIKFSTFKSPLVIPYLAVMLCLIPPCDGESLPSCDAVLNPPCDGDSIFFLPEAISSFQPYIEMTSLVDHPYIEETFLFV